MVARLGIPIVLLLAPSHPIRGQQSPSADELLRQFESETLFTRQFEVAKAIVANEFAGFILGSSSLLIQVRELVRSTRNMARHGRGGVRNPRGHTFGV
jgi:hypothetical protein